MTQTVYVYDQTAPNAVPVAEAPALDIFTAHLNVDDQGTFMDLPGNDELPVAGGVAVQPNILKTTQLGVNAGILMVATQDTHTSGNVTWNTSYEGIAPYTWISASDVFDVWTSGENPIGPNARFNLDEVRRWMELDAQQARPRGGFMAWSEHGSPDSPFYHIYGPVYAAFMRSTNNMLMRKGERASQLIPGFVPESYSAVQMSTGESLGLAEFLKANGISRVIVTGIAGDFCPWETGVDLLDLGFEVWYVVDAQASVCAPNFAGTGKTSEELAVTAAYQAGARFCTTKSLVDVNRQFAHI